jgi:hypothetical protein
MFISIFDVFEQPAKAVQDENLVNAGPRKHFQEQLSRNSNEKHELFVHVAVV